MPAWAALLASALEELSPDLLTIMAEDTAFRWHEVLGVPAEADPTTVRQAWTALALLYHPDKRGRPEQMVRLNAADASEAREKSIPALKSQRERLLFKWKIDNRSVGSVLTSARRMAVALNTHAPLHFS